MSARWPATYPSVRQQTEWGGATTTVKCELASETGKVGMALKVATPVTLPKQNPTAYEPWVAACLLCLYTAQGSRNFAAQAEA